MKISKRMVIQIILGIIYIFLLVLFSIKSLESGSESSKLSRNVSENIVGVINNTFNKDIKVTDTFEHYVRKIIGHYGYFVILGSVSVFFYLLFNKLKHYIRFIIHFTTGFIFAFLTEFVFQNIASNRTASMKDVGIDYLGFITFSTVVCIIYYIKIYKKKKKEEE